MATGRATGGGVTQPLHCCRVRADNYEIVGIKKGGLRPFHWICACFIGMFSFSYLMAPLLHRAFRTRRKLGRLTGRRRTRPRCSQNPLPPALRQNSEYHMDYRMTETEFPPLFEVSRIASHTKSVEQALNDIIQILAGFPAVTQAFVLLENREDGRLGPAAAYCAEGQAPNSLEMFAECGKESVCRGLQPFVITDSGSFETFTNLSETRTVNKSRVALICAPVVYRGANLGVIGVDDLLGAAAPLDRELERLSVLGAIVGLLVGPGMRPENGAFATERWPKSLVEIEKTNVVEALKRHNMIQSRAAKALGITLRQMGYRVKKYGLEDLIKQRARSQ